MSNRLTLWLPVDATRPWHYHIDPDVTGSCSTAAQKAELASLGAKEIWVILPGQWVRSFALDLPKMREQDRLSAACLAIEDKLGSGIKNQHVVLSSDTPARAGVIASRKISDVQEALAAAGLQANALYADFEALKPEKSVIGLDDRVITSGLDGFTLDPDTYDALPDMPSFQSWDLTTLSETVSDVGAVNFLQGKFARSRFDITDFKAFARIGALAALLAVSGLVWTGMQSRAASLQANDMKTQMRQVYELATGQSAPSNPALAVTRAQRSGGEIEADFMTLSSVLFSALAQTPSVMVESLQFDNSNNRLTVRLIYPSFDTATDIEAAISERGGVFQTGGVREQGDRLVGDAVLTLGARS